MWKHVEPLLKPHVTEGAMKFHRMGLFLFWCIVISFLIGMAWKNRAYASESASWYCDSLPSANMVATSERDSRYSAESARLFHKDRCVHAEMATTDVTYVAASGIDGPHPIFICTVVKDTHTWFTKCPDQSMLVDRRS